MSNKNQYPVFIIEQISQDKIVVVLMESVKITFSCEISTGIQFLTEDSVIHIPEHCQVIITGCKFFNSKELVKAIQFRFPTITIPVIVENSSLPQDVPLNLSYIDHNFYSSIKFLYFLKKP